MSPVRTPVREPDICAFETINEESNAPRFPLARRFSEIPHQIARRLSHLPRRRSTISRSISNELTHSWIRNSRFDLSNLEEPEVVEEEVVGRPTQLDMKETVLDANQIVFEVNEEDNCSIEKIKCAEDMWKHSKTAKTSMLTACTMFYALFLTIFSLVLELSHILNDERKERKVNMKDMVFGIYMYGFSLVFFIYMYVVLLLHPKWYSTMTWLRRIFSFGTKPVPDSSESSGSLSSAGATVRKITHSSPSAGSLFLRLGSVVFGTIGLVYYAFRIFICSANSERCKALETTLDVCAIVFIFFQMHFIFCNWKLSITGNHMIARWGTMHLVAANLWTWIRYILMEEDAMEQEITEAFKTKEHVEENHNKTICIAAECILGSLSEVMFTSIVEYSLIAAAVMYIVWRNIGKVTPGTYVKRKYQIRVDCSKTTTGLFLGLAFLASTFSAMVVYYGFTMMKESEKAAFVYAFTDIFQYVFSTIGCFIAIYQMRALKYFNKKSENLPNSDQELLDQILLSIGLVGELIYSVSGLVGLTGETSWKMLTFALLFVHIFRLMQVGTQTFLLYVAKNVRMGSEDRERQPGKQAITFLLTANLGIFFMNLFESEKAGVSEIIIDFYGKRSWVFLVRSFSPLTIFYRFHSSVCLAEIWKNVYATKSVAIPAASTNTIA